MTYSAVLFDLDGTLLDTLEDLADSMNTVLARRGLPAHPVEAYKTFVGDGVLALARRTLPDEATDEETLHAVVAEMRSEYARRWAEKTRPYEGIVELLAELQQRGTRLAVLSNKPDDFTRLCVERFFEDIHFEVVRGVTDGTTPKPDPTGAKDICATIGVAPEQVLYLGDTNTDMQTATAAGMYAVGATWGFRTAEELLAHGAKTLVDHPAEVLALL